MTWFLVAVLGHLAMPAIGQAADFARQELPPACAFAFALLRFGGDSNRR